MPLYHCTAPTFKAGETRWSVFLHEYQPGAIEGQLLTQIMTAPMLVTHWINMQYFASTVDNRRFGSGNKTLHNVVGGNIGLLKATEAICAVA